MAQWLLNAAHVIFDKYLEKGTVVGDGTDHPIECPTMDMSPLDKDAAAKTAEIHAAIAPDSPGYVQAPPPIVEGLSTETPPPKSAPAAPSIPRQPAPTIADAAKKE